MAVVVVGVDRVDQDAAVDDDGGGRTGNHDQGEQDEDHREEHFG